MLPSRARATPRTGLMGRSYPQIGLSTRQTPDDDCRWQSLRSRTMSPPWSVEQVLELAPDAPSQKAARSLAKSAPWRDIGYHADGPSLFGFCAGSGANPYQTCIDLGEPAYRCSCPSRKFPCKHALALMLLWSAGSVPETDPPQWLTEWREGRAARQAKTATRTAGPPS